MRLYTRNGTEEQLNFGINVIVLERFSRRRPARLYNIRDHPRQLASDRPFIKKKLAWPTTFTQCQEPEMANFIVKQSNKS